MIKTKDEWERVKVVADAQSGPSLQHAVDTIEIMRKVVRQAPAITVLEHGTDICSFCRAHPADDHYAHCAYAALPDWLTE